MAEEYKIELGVKLKDGDIQSQINDAQKTLKPIELKVDAETKELTNTIKEALNSLSKGTKNALTLDTSKLESSLRDVTSTIREIKNSIGSLDGGNMKSLVSSINSISTALDKASDKFDGLIADLKTLSSKDFSVNLGLNIGGSNPIGRNAAYGNKARGETLPQLKQQMDALIKYYNDVYKTSLNEVEVLSKMIAGTPLGSGNAFQNLLFSNDSMFAKIGSKTLSTQMQGYKEYIDIFKQAASLKGLDLSSVTSGFSKSADDLIKDAQDIQTGANEMKDGFEKLKQIFNGGGIDAEGLSALLDPIIKDLTAIREAVVNLSKGISIDGLTQSFDRLSDTLEKLVANAVNVGNALNGVASGTSGTSSAIHEFKAIDVAIDNVENSTVSLESALKRMGMSDDDISKITQQVNSLSVAVNKVTGAFNSDGSFSVKVSGVKELNNDLEQTVTLMQRFGADGSVGNLITTLTEDFKKASAAFDELKAKADKLSTSASISNVDKQYINTESALKRLSQVVPNVQVSFDVLKGTYKELTSAQQHYKNVMSQSDATDEQKIDAMNRLVDANERYQNILATTNNLIATQSKVESMGNNSDSLMVAKENALLRLKRLFGDNSEAARKFGSEVDRIQKEINECGNLPGIKNLNQQITNLGLKVKETGYQTKTFGQKLKKQFSQYSTYLSVASLFSYGTQALRDMFEQVKLIDSAMTELKKVTDETDESYNRFLTNAASRAKEIGTTIDGLVSSTADFARLGYGFEDAQGLAEVANIYAVVGDEINGVEGATESLISTMAAFKDEMNGMSDTDFAMSIIDKFNEIGNNFAISSGGIGEALERSASSLMAANNTIDESIALITAANTVVGFVPPNIVIY